MSPIKLESLPSWRRSGFEPEISRLMRPVCCRLHYPAMWHRFGDVAAFLPSQRQFGAYVRMEGFEPPTPWPQTKSHSRLRTSRVPVFPSRQKNSLPKLLPILATDRASVKYLLELHPRLWPVNEQEEASSGGLATVVSPLPVSVSNLTPRYCAVCLASVVAASRPCWV